MIVVIHWLVSMKFTHANNYYKCMYRTVVSWACIHSQVGAQMLVLAGQILIAKNGKHPVQPISAHNYLSAKELSHALALF